MCFSPCYSSLSEPDALSDKDRCVTLHGGERKAGPITATVFSFAPRRIAKPASCLPLRPSGRSRLDRQPEADATEQPESKQRFARPPGPRCKTWRKVDSSLLGLFPSKAISLTPRLQVFRPPDGGPHHLGRFISTAGRSLPRSLPRRVPQKPALRRPRARPLCR